MFFLNFKLFDPYGHDVTSGHRQKIVQSTDTIPTFQYTTTPVVPKEVYTPGMTGKVGLQELDGCDPIFIVKLPKQYRLAPSSLRLNSYLRSTWFLKHGIWQCVESFSAYQGMGRTSTVSVSSTSGYCPSPRAQC